MNRNVVTVEDAHALQAATAGAAFAPPAPPAGTPTADDYWNRLLKYIPIEVIGVYLAASDAVSSVTGHTRREVVLWIIFGVVLAIHYPGLPKKRRRDRAPTPACDIRACVYCLGVCTWGPVHRVLEWLRVMDGRPCRRLVGVRLRRTQTSAARPTDGCSHAGVVRDLDDCPRSL